VIPALRGAAKRIVRLFLPELEAFSIYTARVEDLAIPDGGDEEFLPATAEDVRAASDPALREMAWLAGDDAVGFVARVGGEVATVCWFWSGERYRAKRNFLPLREGEAKLVEIRTGERFRGRGLAPRVIARASRAMFARGFRRLFARIWHSNTASKRAFERAGWAPCGTIVTFRLRGFRRRFRIERLRRGD